MPAVDAPALSPLAPLGDVAGRYPKHAVEVIATGDPDRACLRVDDPPHHRVMLVDVPRGRVLAEDSLRQVPAPPPEGVRLGDPRWRVRTCNYGPNGDVRWLLAWIDPASARVLATVDRPHHAFDRDVVVRDDEVVLIGNTWHARDGGRLVAQGPAAKAVDDAAIAPDAPWTGVGDHVARDGSHGFVLRDQVLWRVDLRTGRRESFQVGHGRRVEAVAYAPRSDRLASVATDGEALVWRLDDATPDAALEAAPDARGVVFAVDGRALMVLSAQRVPTGGGPVDVAARLRAFDLAAGAERARVELAAPSSDLVGSPDGAWAVPAFGLGGETFAWFDVARGAVMELRLPAPKPPDAAPDPPGEAPLFNRDPPLDDAPPWCAGFAPDGALVLLHTLGTARSHPPRVALTAIDPAAGSVRSTRVLRRPVTLARGTRLSVDGARLALRQHERIAVVDLATERSAWHADVRAGGGWSLWGGVTRLGHAVLAYRDEWGGLTVARLDRKALRRVEAPSAEITALALSADEREVAAGLADGRVLRWRTDG